ncbi:hypothetical protein DAPPUDRAFT_54890, partial [Daphnia pulex]
LLFNPGKPFSCCVKPTVSCLPCFRINPHNNEFLKVCLNPHSPPTFHYVIVASLYR